MVNLKELAEVLTSVGILLTGIASLITAIKPKKEQPLPRSRPRRNRK